MEKILYIEEVDGQPCLLLDTDIIEHTCLKVGQTVRVIADENCITVEKKSNE
ncbi:hypothetical protein [Eisenbergiella tayi]|uniref:Uncharacterized protein n=1 Tax=Eisenbergiella tayi TaxID=1432052 RepID=A0A1E3A3P2_9FIRM|nr:hypothetical protein [Eisenbergiella tayi]ODM03239.1 hypothetical protein BEI61_04033 [Eisenbergiella tayi]